jgi:hypothetical protein
VAARKEATAAKEAAKEGPKAGGKAAPSTKEKVGGKTYEQLREQRTARPKPEIMGPPGASQYL